MIPDVKRWKLDRSGRETSMLSLQGHGPTTVISPEMLTVSLAWEMLSGGWIAKLRKVCVCVHEMTHKKEKQQGLVCVPVTPRDTVQHFIMDSVCCSSPSLTHPPPSL